MITPDGGGHDGNRSRTGRAVLLGAAALVVFAGLIAVGVLTSPNPQVADEATTTTGVNEIEPPVDPDAWTVSQIARGEQFDWQSSLSVDEGFPIALLDHRGSIYLFATEAPDFSGLRPGGLQAWKTTDGVAWEPLGQVIPDNHVISGVSSTGQGLVALEPGSPGTGFTVWRSPDGVDWEPEDVEVHDSSDLIVMRPVSTGGAEGLLVVSGAEHLHVSDLIEERLDRRYSTSIEMEPYGWSTSITFDDEILFTLYGPVGLPLATVTADELELTERERTLIEEVYADADQRSIWVKTRSGWTVREIPDADVIQWIGSTPDGRVIATGYGKSGLNAWATRDGSSWESLPSFPGPYHIDSWGNRIVGPSNSRRASILVSNNSGGWDDIGPAGYLPALLDWSIGSLGAGRGGVAAIINGWGELPGESLPQAPPTLTNEDATLTLRFRSGEYTLDTGDPGKGPYRWSMGGDTPGGMQADLEAGTLSFHDPDTGELLATFDFASINQAANEYWSNQGSRGNVQAFSFTDERGAWTIQDLTPMRGIEIGLVEVTDSHVVLAGIRDDFNPTTAPGFEVWSGEIP